MDKVEWEGEIEAESHGNDYYFQTVTINGKTLTNLLDTLFGEDAWDGEKVKIIIKKG